MLRDTFERIFQMSFFLTMNNLIRQILHAPFRDKWVKWEIFKVLFKPWEQIHQMNLQFLYYQTHGSSSL